MWRKARPRRRFFRSRRGRRFRFCRRGPPRSSASSEPPSLACGFRPHACPSPENRGRAEKGNRGGRDGTRKGERRPPSGRWGRMRRRASGGRGESGKVQRGRTLRSEATLAERTLWQRLRYGQMQGCKFRRQHCVAGFIVDFFCPALIARRRGRRSCARGLRTARREARSGVTAPRCNRPAFH
jgi:hypothetical protein